MKQKPAFKISQNMQWYLLDLSMCKVHLYMLVGLEPDWSQ